MHPKTSEAAIVAGVNTIARQAWAETPEINQTSKGLKKTKQTALRLIRQLPPWLRGQVEHRFISTKWAPLLERQLVFKPPI
jgi:hypothetical protein